MDKNKEISIRCKGSRSLSFRQLKAFQGNLKELSKERAEELKCQIKELGWIAPVFVWNDREILDGHQRMLVLPDLLKEGYTIGDIPVVDIEAETKRKAAKILLALNSRYGVITDEGLYEFMDDMDLNIDDLANIKLPDVDLEGFKGAYFGEFEPAGEDEQGKLDEKAKVKCPECGAEFTP